MCKYCNIDKLLEEFAIFKQLKDGRANKCKECHQKYIINHRNSSTKEHKLKEAKLKVNWYLENKDRIRERDKFNYLKISKEGIPQYKKYGLRRFGLEVFEYLDMIENQNNKCAICGKNEITRDRKGEIRTLAIDHDHSTGKVRQLLCSTCNNGLGWFKDDIFLMNAAINYLIKHKNKVRINNE